MRGRPPCKCPYKSLFFDLSLPREGTERKILIGGGALPPPMERKRVIGYPLNKCLRVTHPSTNIADCYTDPPNKGSIFVNIILLHFYNIKVGY